MNKDIPKVSVVIPTYNRLEMVREAIFSVLAQTYTNSEILVIDDGSTDGTSEALQTCFGDRIRYVWQENQGESVARNHGIELASGEFVAFLDSDDTWLPRKIEKQVAFLNNNPHIGLISCQVWRIDGEGQRLSDNPSLTDLNRDDFVFEKLVISNKVPGPSTVMLRKSLLEQYGGFDPAIRFGEDWDFYLRLLRHTKFDIIAEPLICLRRHIWSQSYYASAADNQRKLSDHIRLLERAFDQGNGQGTKSLRSRALAVQYRNAFLREIAVGNNYAAVENINSAIALESGIIGTCEFSEQVIYSALRYSEQEGNEPAASVFYVKQVLKTLRKVYPISKRFERKLMADLYLARVYVAHQQGDQKRTRHYCIKTIEKNFGIIRNRGFVSIFTGAIIGTRMKGKIQGILKSTGHG